MGGSPNVDKKILSVNIIKFGQCVFLGRINTKASSLLDFPYVHRKLKQTLALCYPQVAIVCFSFMWVNKKIILHWRPQIDLVEVNQSGISLSAIVYKGIFT